MILQVRRYPIAAIKQDDLNIFRCLHFLDWGCRNVYIVDDTGMYIGIAFTRKGIISGWTRNEVATFWNGNHERIGTFSAHIIKEYSHEEQVEYFREVVEKFPSQEEFPVLDDSGKIVYVIEKQKEAVSIDWEKISFPEGLRKYQKIYLSSLGSDNLLGFFTRYRSEVEMYVLSKDNLDEALSQGGIVFDCDGLPECGKVNLVEAVRQHEKAVKERAKKAEEETRRKKEEEERLQQEAETKKHNKEVKKILPLVHIAKEWAALKENELHDTSQFIEKFDEWYHTVSITDSEGNFKFFITKEQFEEKFPQKEFIDLGNTCLECDDEEDEDTLKRSLAEAFLLDESLKEIPIVRDGKVIALGRFAYYFDLDGKWDSRQVYNFSWDWIDEGVAKEFFLNRRRILISSTHGYLKGFVERFSSWLDITVYQDFVLGDCLAKDFDFMLYGADVFRSFSMEKWDAHRLFIMLLAETVRRWLAQQGVAFYFFSLEPELLEIQDRIAPINDMVGATEGFLRDGVNPYFVVDGNAYDKVLNKDALLPNFHSGRRVVIPATKRPKNDIFFYGTCTVVGFATYSPDKTIESCLQKILNNDDVCYRVHNCGTEGLMLNSMYYNWLYRVMDTQFRCGDIVVVFGHYPYLWGGDNRFAPVCLHPINKPFLEPDNINKKLFIDPCLAHMNDVGYEIMSDYVYQVIKNNLICSHSEMSSRTCFFMTINGVLARNSRIGKCLEKFPVVHKRGTVIGAVVLKTNLITKGHIFLMEEAAKQCDALYVFLIDRGMGFLPVNKNEQILRGYADDSVEILTYDLCDRQSYEWNFNASLFVSGQVNHEFNPVDDTYTFARFIAPKLGIVKYFVGEETFDMLENNYNIIRHEILMENNIEYIEIPRKQLDDGRDIITERVRQLWYAEGWRACKDYLPELECRMLEEEMLSDE